MPLFPIFRLHMHNESTLHLPYLNPHDSDDLKSLSAQHENRTPFSIGLGSSSLVI